MVNQSMLEGSKTGKAAEADIMFCLTKIRWSRGRRWMTLSVTG